MRNKFFLIVEDDPNDTELILRTFERLNSQNTISVANDGIEAMEFLNCTGKFAEREKVNPALIILDKKMPRMDGIETLREIRKSDSLRKIPVVMFTSSKYEKDINDSYNTGANAYVVKPIKPEEFFETVKSIAQFWGEKNELPVS